MTVTEIPWEPCGRPTKAKRPCRQMVRLSADGQLISCPYHQTPEEQSYERGWLAGHYSGWTEGCKSGRESAQRDMEFSKQQQQREQDAKAAFRTEADGYQIVVVGSHTYKWDKSSGALSVGDRVLLPENWVSRMKKGPGAFEDVVTELGSSYQGTLSEIIRRAASA